MANSDDPRYKDHKDKTVLYYALGKAMFDENFRERIFCDPERAADSTGLDECVVKAIVEIGRDDLEDFVKKTELALTNAATNASYC